MHAADGVSSRTLVSVRGARAFSNSFTTITSTWYLVFQDTAALVKGGGVTYHPWGWVLDGAPSAPDSDERRCW